MASDTEGSPDTADQQVEDLGPDLGLDLEQQAALGSGVSFWRTEELPGVPALVLTDGPHGVRFQSGASDHLGLSASNPATCFPPAAGLAQSWDPSLARRIGSALAAEAVAAGVGVLLGPGINIKRDPRTGRNFEYFSEDPHLTGVMAGQVVAGLQAGGVGASLKHFAANNSEHDRMRASSDVDPRPLREIYLRAFERVVRDARPWTVMTAYNKLNGVYASENRWLLTELLRDEWGFAGAVTSDWGAVVDRVASVRAGLDLQMPGPAELDDADVVRAVEQGELDRADVLRAATAVARLAVRARRGRQAALADAGHRTASVDHDAHHALAREAAEGSIVLLANDGGILPLSPGTGVAVIGAFARDPRFQGGGSSHVTPTRVDVPLTEIRRIAGDAGVTHATGFGVGDDDEDLLFAEAVAVASDAEVAVLMLGLTDDQESEGVDRQHIDLPGDQLRLLEAVAAVQERIVVILSAGSVVDLTPVVPHATAILSGALLGQGGGRALARVLYGHATPSGRLAETVPLRIEDAPSWDNFPAEDSHVRYGEGLFVGYRGYDHRRREVRFPFGHGLSYTAFDYRSMTVVAREGGCDEGWTARVEVHNTGPYPGREVVQIYSSLPASVRSRAPRELVGFGHIDLEPGQSGQLEVLIERRDLAYWDEPAGSWLVEGGEYVFAAAASSRDLRLEVAVPISGDPRPVRIDLESTLSEARADPAARVILDEVFRPFAANADEASGAVGASIEQLVGSIPVGRMLAGFLGMNRQAVARIAEQLARIHR